MPTIRLQGHIIVPDGDLPKILLELPKHIELTRQEGGCLTFDVSQDPDNKNRFNVYEEFVDHNAFENHQKRVKNSNWGRITANAERHYSIDTL